MHHVIIGAGPAGVIAAETLRKADSSAKITILAGENEPPYSRMAIPYKLKGVIDESGMYLRHNENHYESLNIEIRYCVVAKIDPQNKQLSLQNGSQVQYDKLLIATGATPQLPPIKGVDLPGVHTSWTMDDMREIEQLAKKGAKVVQIGAGFIACTNMEGIVSRGVDLTVVEQEDRMVPRMMDKVAGNMISDWCVNQGVNVLTGRAVMAIEERVGAACRLRVRVKTKNSDTAITTPDAVEKKGFMASLSSMLFGNEDKGGESAPSSNEKILDADLVIVATGVRTNIGFLEGTGIEVDQGILVNEKMETSVVDIFAAGDCAQGKDFSTGKKEVQAIQPVAIEHGQLAARNMLGQEVFGRGTLNMNVLDSVGLVSSSYGLWMGVKGGDSAKVVDKVLWRYINLQFDGDVLVGATTVGVYGQHIGAIKSLIQMRLPLGKWKESLTKDPSRITEAWLACTQSTVIN